MAGALLALHHAESDRAELARSALDRLLARIPGMPRYDVNAVLAGMAEAAAALGDRSRAATIYDRLVPYAGLVIVSGFGVWCAGAADHYLALLSETLGRPDEAAARFDEALRLHRRLQSPPLVAHSEHCYGRLLLRRGGAHDRQRAEEELARSLTTAEGLGMTRLAAHCRRLVGSVPSVPARAT